MERVDRLAVFFDSKYLGFEALSSSTQFMRCSSNGTLDLRATANVNRALERAMAERDWCDAGQGWQGKETT